MGLLSIGEEPTKGNDLVKAAHALLAEPGALGRSGARFLGNVEGRDIMTADVDVVVTDGFTGNVALKTLEGGMRALVRSVVDALGATSVADEAIEALMPLYGALDPDTTGGAMLLGVDGVCIISHGSSSATAIVNGAGRRRHGLGRRGRAPACGRRHGVSDPAVHKRTKSGVATLRADPSVTRRASSAR